ncbi:MAG: S6e family ribosomal protein [Candidatus Diapherotrites archaeon]
MEGLKVKLVISDPKSGKAFSKNVEDSAIFIGKKIGEEISLDSIGLGGYTAKISGGSDKDGFPMRMDLSGAARRKIFIVSDKRSGTKIRISKRGNTAGKETSQLNLVVSKHGSTPFQELMPKEKVEVKQESVKEQMIKESHEAAAKMSAEEARKFIKGKAKA